MRLVIAGLIVGGLLEAQVCSLSVAGLNRNRRVMGPVNVECPAPLHSAPFGNWGVTSNFGEKLDGHQFDGWCHDSPVRFNNGEVRTACRSEWHQWNSCTAHPDFAAPNCTIYNDADCTEQVSATGVNVIGTQQVQVPVGCPVDADDDGVADFGGCADVRSYSHGVNFMSIYELDPFTGDTLVQSLFYPPTAVSLDCDPTGCEPNGSSWLRPTGLDDPSDRALIDAEFAMAVNGGVFVDADRRCGALLSAAQPVSAASYSDEAAAPDSIVSLFGRDLAPRAQAAVSTPLPVLLAGTGVEVVDAEGARRPAPLIFVSPLQVNLIVPSETALGVARFEVRRLGAVIASGRIDVRAAAPGVFSADASGAGPAAAVVTRLAPNGKRTSELTFACDAGVCSSRRLLRGGDRLFVSLFGTGWRSSSEAVGVRLGEVAVEVLYAGAQGGFDGLDQLNFEIPSGVEGEVSVAVRVGNRPANVTVLAVAP